MHVTVKNQITWVSRTYQEKPVESSVLPHQARKSQKSILHLRLPRLVLLCKFGRSGFRVSLKDDLASAIRLEAIEGCALSLQISPDTSFSIKASSDGLMIASCK